MDPLERHRRALERDLDQSAEQATLLDRSVLLLRLRDMLAARESLIMFVALDDGMLVLDEVSTVTDPTLGLRIQNAFNNWSPEERRHALPFDPLAPPAPLRNLALPLSGVERLLGVPVSEMGIARLLGPLFDFPSPEPLFMLVASEMETMAYVAAFRPEPFGPRETALLQSVASPLVRRLERERESLAFVWSSAALDAVLEEIAAPAFVFARTGRVLHANLAGRTALEHDPAETTRAIRESLTERNGPFEAVSLKTARGPVFLLRAQRAGDAIATRVQLLSERWGLTPRQQQVLEHLARGEANKTIALALGTSLRTVEAHVAAVLERAGVSSRAALAAKFWG